jgi:NAD(P)-dependent dehydrogenase (short-subunit alcohol dehydrogenase family)
MELNGKVAVITGGNGGIGRAMARAFLDEGAKAVMLADLDPTAVARAAQALGCDGMACEPRSATARSICSVRMPARAGRAC